MILPGIIARTKPDIIMLLAFFAILVSTAIGWLDPGIMILILALMALLYAGVVRRMIGG
jgi:hypothetical protein